MRRVFPFILIGLLSGFSFGQDAIKKTPAVTLGLAQTDITPTKPLLMSGYEVQVTRLRPGAEGPLVRRSLELIRAFLVP